MILTKPSRKENKTPPQAEALDLSPVASCHDACLDRLKRLQEEDYRHESGVYRRLETSVSDENIEKKRKLITEHRQLIVSMIADELQINRESVGQIGENVKYVKDSGVLNELIGRTLSGEVDRDDVQDLLDSYNQELTLDELTEVHEQEEQDIEEFESLDPVQSKDRMKDVNWSQFD
ncbi:hypothetical protein TNCV_3960581 [Trichonephila clavipes]|nr:hypothetical protein TNCV_3960581 [Trichonephila clavipes]